MELLDQVIKYKKASEAFHSCSDSYSSVPLKSPTSRKIIDDYFGYDMDLMLKGLELNDETDNLDKLQTLVLRWAVWRQAATYTAQLELGRRHEDKDSLYEADNIVIMKMLGRAETALFEEITKEK